MFNDDIKIHEARYANSRQDSIIVLFSSEKDTDLGIQETEVEVNEDDAYYQSLLTKVSLEDIVDMTAEYKRLGSLEYNTTINNMVTKLATELAEDLYGQKVAQIKKEYELYKLDLHAEKERYIQEITKTLMEERNAELDHHRKKVNQELDQYYNKEYVNKTKLLDEEYKVRSKVEAEQLAKDMLGITTMQQEKERLMEEKEKLSKSVKSREEKLIGLDQAVKIKSNKADSVVFDFIIEKNYEKEELFKLKLWALELPNVKKADKSIKSKIRKCTSIIKVMTVLDEIVD